MKVLNLVGLISLALSTNAWAGSFACDERFDVQASNGTPAIDCRAYGRVAEDVFYSLAAGEEKTFNDAGQFSGYRKSTGYTTCIASPHKTAFQCDEILDAETGEQKPIQ